MHILSLETSTKNLSIAVSKDGKVLRTRNMVAEKILESSMVKAIDKLLVSSSLDLKKIDVLAVGLGPGSFTSLRVGLSTVKAFAFALNKKVIGVCSLDMIASGVQDQECDEICVIVDARRGNVYTAIYDKNLKLKTQYLLTTIDQILTQVKGATLFVGDGLGLYKDQIEKAYQKHGSKCKAVFSSEKFWFPKAQELTKLAYRRVEQKKFDDPERVVPIYLYPQDCQVDRK